VKILKRRALLVWVLIVVTLFAAAVFDVMIWPSPDLPILYAVPLAIAARYVSRQSVVVVAVAAIGFDFASIVVSQPPLQLWPFTAASLVVVSILAIQVAEWRETAQRRAQQAEVANKQLQEFMGMVAHDLRNPLTGIVLYTGLVRQQLEANRVESSLTLLSNVESATNRVRRLVDDLLDATRIGGNRFTVKPLEMDLVSLAGDVIDEFQREQSTHRLSLDAPASLCGMWDRERLRQVFTNLVSNAIKYSAVGRDVRIRLRSNANGVVVAVSDEGDGIPREAMSQLFQPFARLGQERRVSGTGLGLFITKGIVEAHGGSIRVESMVGKGSIFYVELPLKDRNTRAMQ